MITPIRRGTKFLSRWRWGTAINTKGRVVHAWRWGPGRPQKKNTNGDGVQGDPKRRTRMAMGSRETPKKNTNGDGVQGDPKRITRMAMGP